MKSQIIIVQITELIDHIHEVGGKEQVIHNDKQLEAQRDMLEDKVNHWVK
jgi:hypothetical protein